MEKFLDWIIDEKNVTTGFFSSDAKVKLQAKIYPNIESLYNFLYENQIVKMPFETTVEAIRLQRKNGLYTGYYDNNFDYDFEQALEVVNLLVAFCKTQQYSLTETAHAFLSISSTGNEHTYKRAMSKIKNNIREQLPNLRMLLVAFLKEKNIINKETNIICEIYGNVL